MTERIELMAFWWILAAWVGVSLLLVAGIAVGSSLGYRRGWEDRDALGHGAHAPRTSARSGGGLEDGSGGGT